MEKIMSEIFFLLFNWLVSTMAGNRGKIHASSASSQLSTTFNV